MQRCRWVAVFFVLVVVPIGSAHAAFRLVGLERLYFEHGMGADKKDAAKAHISEEVIEAIPSRLPRPDFDDSDAQIHQADSRFQVDDIAIPLRNAGRPRWIRQVCDRSHPRIFDVWWVLYDDGRRTDIWHFSAMPAKNDRKVLSNYFLQRIARSHDGRVVFEVSGTMFRPDGAWSITRKDFYFNVADESLVYQRVINTFGFFNPYDRGAGGQTDVRTERELDGRIEVREIHSFSREAARECQFHGLDEDVVVGEPDMMTVAQCLTQRPEVIVKYRDFATPSVIERQGSTGK